MKEEARAILSKIPLFTGLCPDLSGDLVDQATLRADRANTAARLPRKHRRHAEGRRGQRPVRAALRAGQGLFRGDNGKEIILNELGPGDGVASVTGTLRIPDRLYGREATTERLNGLIAGQAEGKRGGSLLGIAGQSGIGKSALVERLAESIVAAGGHVTQGEFDQTERARPSAPFAQVFSALLRSLLAGTTEQVDAWHTYLLDALSSNAQVLLDILSGYETLIGPQPTVAKLGLNEAQIRMSLVCRRFVGALARADSPLVIFIDDLQWSDSASRSLSELLLTDPEIRHRTRRSGQRDRLGTPGGRAVRDAGGGTRASPRHRGGTARAGGGVRALGRRLRSSDGRGGESGRAGGRQDRWQSLLRAAVPACASAQAAAGLRCGDRALALGSCRGGPGADHRQCRRSGHRAHPALSLLCVPPLSKGDVVAMVYLENAGVRGAFSADRCITVETLGEQAAVSIDLVTVAGREARVRLYEVFDADPEPLREQKLRTRDALSDWPRLYRTGNDDQAACTFGLCRDLAPDNPPPGLLAERCGRCRDRSAGPLFDGIERIGLK
jgi:hypothetical protein